MGRRQGEPLLSTRDVFKGLKSSVWLVQGIRRLAAERAKNRVTGPLSKEQREEKEQHNPTGLQRKDQPGSWVERRWQSSRRGSKRAVRAAQ